MVQSDSKQSKALSGFEQKKTTGSRFMDSIMNQILLQSGKTK